MKKLRIYFFEIACTAVLILFVWVKIPALHLPYFWDELGVYARGALYMHDNHMGLLPNDLPPELSRGHPLLFFFLISLGFRCFGDGAFTGHCIALCISILLLISVFRIVRKKYSAQSALMAVMLLMVQPLFFAQSVMVLPEMLLALLMLESLFAWSEKKYLRFILISAAAMLTKETAIILPVIILVSEAFSCLFNKKYRAMFQLHVKQLSVLTPFIVYGLFLVIQKAQNGWYLFPLHGENVALSMSRIQSFMHDFSQFLFLEQGRIVLSSAVLLVVVFLLFRKKIAWHPFTVMLIIMIIGGLLFNAINFYMNRYMLFAVIGFVMIAAVVLSQMIRMHKAAVFFVILLIVAGCISMNGRPFLFHPKQTGNISTDFHYDEDMQYAAYLDVEQQAVHALEARVQPGDSIYSNFPTGYILSDPRLGATQLIDGRDFILQDRKLYQTGFRYALTIAPGSYDYRLPAADSLHVIGIYENAVAKVQLAEPGY